MRTRYLLCYDVRDASRLRRTAKVAETWGYRLQYSIFICDLSAMERAWLERSLREVLDLGADYAVLVDLGPPGRSSAGRITWVSGSARLPAPGEATVV
ncbi:cas2: CRISPR-associated endoribonuclease Cas2 [Gaiella occulta]|uniref:CRISPR-associated endoribonuclease Cas2 n=1 Tax=Gaiella occulta TaxID=1002870 RepID=A0A7M2YZR7_9ACTN|nr:CRISPR-associated endonuclease Cas2 [Gaiella occulta]RDI75580.1 cas2: CRISPR-associated endoribonuclease Cas2 [Gaiella occulta]